VKVNIRRLGRLQVALDCMNSKKEDSDIPRIEIRKRNE
jgi:hypothetical protein